jgi:NAD-dependent dihydropyrimidine dehydrogenase PreA subunit
LTAEENAKKSEKLMAKSAAVWYPTVFPDKCNGCEGLEKPQCIEFCPHGVFELKDGKAVVVNPHKCVYGCIACERICPKKAIAFPQRIASMPKMPKDKGLLHKVVCKGCGKTFWTNRDVDVCMDCESKT